MCCSSRGRFITNERKYIDAVIGPQSYHNINDIILAIESKKDKTKLH